MSSDLTLTLHTGRAMPVLGLGTWQLTEDTAGAVEDALRVGYRMIDTSGDYGTHPGVGEGVRRSGIRREDVYIVTKVEEDEDAYEATGRNLAELGMDHVDLILIHRPPARGAGRHLWEGLIRARDEGLARDIGVSNYTAGQIDALVESTGEVPVVDQVEWSPFGWSAEFLDYCRGQQIVVQAYSPLTRTERLDDPTLGTVAADYGKTPAQILLRWDIQKGTAPIPKSGRRDHQQENLAIFDFAIEPRHMRELDQLNEHHSSLGSLPYV